MFLFNLYHQNSKNKLKNKTEPQHPDAWPEIWKTTYIKTYPRFPVLALSKPSPSDKKISDILVARRTKRVFDKKISENQLSSLLYYSIGESDKEYGDGRGMRVYSSGGARFPLEFYIFVFKKIENIETGIYHYNITEHGLTLLKKMDFDDEFLQNIVIYDFARTASFAVIFTAVFERSSYKYRERAYRYIMLEAGGVMQNFSLYAEVLGIGALSMGGVIDDFTENLLDIDGTEESIVHGMFFG